MSKIVKLTSACSLAWIQKHMNQHNDKTPYTYSIYFYRKGSKKHSRKTVIQSDVEGDFVVQPFARKALRRPGDSKAVCLDLILVNQQLNCSLNISHIIYLEVD
jgi:hypothetical protein